MNIEIVNYFYANLYVIKIQIAKLQHEFQGFLRRNRVFIKRIYVASIYTSCGGIANSFFPWHGADPFKNVAHWILGSASPVMAITYCRSQGDSPLVYCLWTTRLQHNERTIAKCLLFAMSWFGTRCTAHDEVTPLDWKLLNFYMRITMASNSSWTLAATVECG